jgi:hypothetical protein
MKLYRSPSAQGGAPTQQSQGAGQPPDTSPPSAQPPSGADPTAAQDGGPAPGQPVQFTAEQQAAVDRVVAERLRRAQERWQADQDAKAKADAEEADRKRLQDEQKWQELAEKSQGKAAELEGKLTTTKADFERATTLISGLLESKVKGLPESMTKLLEGKSIFDQLEIVDAYLAAQPGQAAAIGPRTASTTPTPGAQTAGQPDFVKQAIERQQKRATEVDPFEAMMKR